MRFQYAHGKWCWSFIASLSHASTGATTSNEHVHWWVREHARATCFGEGVLPFQSWCGIVDVMICPWWSNLGSHGTSFVSTFAVSFRNPSVLGASRVSLVTWWFGGRARDSILRCEVSSVHVGCLSRVWRFKMMSEGDVIGIIRAPMN